MEAQSKKCTTKNKKNDSEDGEKPAATDGTGNKNHDRDSGGENVNWEERLSKAEAALRQARANKIQYQQQIQELQRLLTNANATIQELEQEVQETQLKVPCQWNDMYRKLCDYKARFGHTLVPHTWKEDPSLGRFVGNQRVFYKYYQRGDTKHIKSYRIDALNRIGFVWNVKDQIFQQFLQQLMDYQAKHGHFNVPRNFPENQKFSNWVLFQREQYNNLKRGIYSTLTPERIQQLEAVGFNWITPCKEHLLQLERGESQSTRAKIKKKRKISLPTSPSLTTSMSEENTTKKDTAASSTSSSSSNHDTDKNNTVLSSTNGYANKTPDEHWEMRFASLQKFHHQHGHCQVNKRDLPEDWKKYATTHDLIAWTAYQRRQQLLWQQQEEGNADKNECFIDAEKIQRLDQLGFRWTRPLHQPRKNTATVSCSNQKKKKAKK